MSLLDQNKLTSPGPLTLQSELMICSICHHYPLPPQCYRSETFINSNKPIRIDYSQGGFTGYLGRDWLQFTSFDVTDVSVAIIEESWNFFGTEPQWQGILGLAFDSLMKVTMII